MNTLSHVDSGNIKAHTCRHRTKTSHPHQKINTQSTYFLFCFNRLQTSLVSWKQNDIKIMVWYVCTWIIPGTSAFSHGRHRHQANSWTDTTQVTHLEGWQRREGEEGEGHSVFFLSKWGSRSGLLGFGGFLRSFLCPHDLTQLLWKTNTVGVKLKLSVMGMMTLYCAEHTLYVEKIYTADRNIKLMKLHHMYTQWTNKHTCTHRSKRGSFVCWSTTWGLVKVWRSTSKNKVLDALQHRSLIF